MLSFAKEGRFELFLSNDILVETAEALLRGGRFRARLQYPDAAVVQYCQELERIAVLVEDIPGNSHRARPQRRYGARLRSK